MGVGKKPIVYKLGDLEEARSTYIQTIALTGKDRLNAVHSLAFMEHELIIEELSTVSAGTDELKTVDAWAVSMTFFTMSNPDQSYPFQNDLKNNPQ